MTAESLLKVLAAHPFAKDFPPDYLDRLAGLASEVRFSTDQVVFREGEECGRFYLILSGRVALEIVAPGRTFRVQTLLAGDELGWSAMLMRSGTHLQARALEPVETLAFDGAALMRACRESPAFGLEVMSRILEIVAGRLQATRLQLLDIYTPKPRNG